MTGRPDWLYSGLLPLTPERLARTEASRRYADAHAARTAGARARELATAMQLMTIDRRATARANIWCSPKPCPRPDWTVSVLLDTASARAQALTTSSLRCCCSASRRSAAAIVLQRRARLAERMQMQRERAERTGTPRRGAHRRSRAVNRQLENEVAERRGDRTAAAQDPVRSHPGRQARRARPDVGGALARIQPAARRRQDLCRQRRGADRPRADRRGAATMSRAFPA